MITPTNASPNGQVTTGRSNGRSPTGQCGELSLELALRGGKTAAVRRHARAPFGSVRAAYPDGSGMPEIQVTNPSGGILGGDSLRTQATLRPCTSATISTQGASKVYRGSQSRQEATFRLEEGAFLEYLPHHLIPYAGSSHRMRTEFHLCEDSVLLAWEAVCAGRLARGERFCFETLSSRTSLFVDGLPEAIDGFELTGGEEHFGGYSYLGTVLFRSPEAGEKLAEKLHHAVQLRGVLASASAPGAGSCVVRILAPAAGALYLAQNRVRERVRESLGLPPAPRDVR